MGRKRCLELTEPEQFTLREGSGIMAPATRPKHEFRADGLTMQPDVPYGWQKKGPRLGLPARVATQRINRLGDYGWIPYSVYHSEKASTGQFAGNCFSDFVTKDHPKPVMM